MKIVTLLMVVTVCVFAAGYAVFTPRASDAPELGKSESRSVTDPGSPKPKVFAAVPERGEEVLIERAQPQPERKHEPENTSSKQTASAKPASPPPPLTAKEAPATAKEAPKLAPGKLSVPPGHQAVVVERGNVEPAAGANASLLGSRVSVLGTIRDEEGKPQSKILLRDVLVLAEDHDRVDDKGAAVRWRTTLAVADKDLPALEEAKRLGPVTIVTRRSGPEQIAPPAPSQTPQAVQAPQTPRGPVIITGSPNLPTIRTGSPKLPVIIEGPR